MTHPGTVALFDQLQAADAELAELIAGAHAEGRAIGYLSGDPLPRGIKQVRDQLRRHVTDRHVERRPIACPHLQAQPAQPALWPAHRPGEWTCLQCPVPAATTCCLCLAPLDADDVVPVLVHEPARRARHHRNGQPIGITPPLVMLLHCCSDCAPNV